MDRTHAELLDAALSIEARIKSSKVARDLFLDILPRFEAAISASIGVRTESNFKTARREAHEDEGVRDE